MIFLLCTFQIFHPDPTVKEIRFFNSNNSRFYKYRKLFKCSIFFAISQNKDITISPRFYNEDKFLIQNEYRQINSNSNHFSDFSF